MFIEISESNRRTGRTPIRIAMHEIYDDASETNKNGIHWREEYVKKNMNTAKGSSYVVEFLGEDQDIVGGHGELYIDDDGNPYFENSTVVGTIEDVSIETININGKDKKVLMSSGYLYNQRYPRFVKWLREMSQQQEINGSVEIAGKYPNKSIGYDGEYKREYRIPRDFEYTGMAILFTEPPADDSSVLMEINKFKEDFKMANQTNDNQLVVELNEKLESKVTEINELKNSITTKDGEITELNQKLEEKSTELNEVIGELKEVKSKVETYESELNELRAFKKEQVDKELVSELNQALSTYTDEEKEVVKAKIEKFSSEPSKEAIKEIVNEINSEIAKKVVESRKKSNKEINNSEINSAQDLFSDVYLEENNAESIEDLL